MATETIHPVARHRPWYSILYVQVLIAIALGILLGRYYPDLGKQMKPLGDGFIALIKMMIAPIIFCTVVHGISSMGDLKRVGRVGLKALVYFEMVSTVALAIGLIVGKVLQPGRGFNIDPASIDPKSVATYVTKAKEEGIVSHLLGIIPDSYFGALAHADLLQVLLISILSGFAVAFLGKTGEPIAYAVDHAAKMFFGIIRIIVRVAPIRLSARWRSPSAPTDWVRWEPDRADCNLLSDQSAVCSARAWRDRAPLGFSIIRFIATSRTNC
jgi:aerobic C4-dicarboxylate transport protein